MNILPFISCWRLKKKLIPIFLSFFLVHHSEFSVAQGSFGSSISVIQESELERMGVEASEIDASYGYFNESENRYDLLGGRFDKVDVIEALISNNLKTQQVVPGSYVEEELEEIPEDHDLYQIAQNLIADSKANASCSKAASDWKSALSLMGGDRHDVSLRGIIQNASVSGSAENFIQLSNLYDSNCLSKKTTLPQDLIDSGVERLVALIMIEGYPICGALRVDEHQFITARHCFFNSITGEEIFMTGNAEVAMIDDLDTKYSIINTPDSEMTEAPSSFSITSDYIFFETDNISQLMPEMVIQFGESGEDLVLLGYYRFHDIETLFGINSTGLTDSNWKDGIRWSNNSLCRVMEVVPPCRVHYCQSDSQFSGAPIIKRNLQNNALVVAGLHVSTVGKIEGCAFEFPETTGNVAINFPKE